MDRGTRPGRMIVFINGHFHDESDARIAVTDRGLLLGDGVFDTMLAIDDIPQDAVAHAGRLTRHAAAIGIDLDIASFPERARELLQRNGFTSGRHAVRTTVTRGPGPRGIAIAPDIAPTVIMRATPAAPPSGPARLIIAQTVRRNEGSPLSRIKSLGYGDNIAAWREAAAAGADDAIMLNNAGNVTCATASNIFIKVGGVWLTPPLQDGVMDGITRARLLGSHFAREEAITASMARQADGLLLTNSVTGIREGRLI